VRTTVTASPLERDAVFALLSNRVRRAVVDACRTLDAPVPLPQVADAVAASLFEQSETTTAETAMLTSRLELQLHHRHLPKLDAAGVLTYRADDTVLAELDGDALSQLATASDALSGSRGDTLAAE
jgi:hypothetical protein